MVEIFKRWLDTLRHTVFTQGNNHSILSGHETRPNNIGLHCGSARIAIARYLGDTADLERAATVFKGWRLTCIAMHRRRGRGRYPN
jgi:hypothetical protein